MHPLELTLLATHLMATVFMTGLIWFVQLVHYPLFGAVGKPDFAHYQAGHLARTGWLVKPVMLVEATTAIWLAILPSNEYRGPALLSGALLLVVWTSTWMIQVPLHWRLKRGYDAEAAAKLVKWNWIRTWGWSARSLVALWMLIGSGAS